VDCDTFGSTADVLGIKVPDDPLTVFRPLWNLSMIVMGSVQPERLMRSLNSSMYALCSVCLGSTAWTQAA
jgi:hypothetical protein